MNIGNSLEFFDRQFRRQVEQRDFQLNPFELEVLPHLHGRVRDEREAIFASLCDQLGAALHRRAHAAALPVEAIEADLRHYRIGEDFDCVVSIGLLAFLDCATASRVLSMLQDRVRRGGIIALNTLIAGTSYLDMFGAADYCLFARDELPGRFAGWEILHSGFSDFDAPGQTVKSFVTLIARKP